jgi:hypothetical protein
MASTAAGLTPSPQWLPRTSMFSLRSSVRCTVVCQSTMPSERV